MNENAMLINSVNETGIIPHIAPLAKLTEKYIILLLKYKFVKEIFSNTIVCYVGRVYCIF